MNATIEETDQQTRYVARALELAPDVDAVLALRRQTGGVFLYLMRTRLAAPRYVIGTTDERFVEIKPAVKAGTYWMAREQWMDLTGELLPEEEGAHGSAS